jgi:RimJ/RimL family protein N-acetyltransferase
LTACLFRYHRNVHDVVLTKRMVLGVVAAVDVDRLFELDADPQVMKWINGGRASARDDVVRFVSESGEHRWVAFDRASGTFLGWFGLMPSARGEAELGYRLRKVVWGNGFATEGSCELIRLGFESGLQRVWAQTMTRNVMSRQVMERCGMKFVRTFFSDWPDVIEGGEEGDVEYEIIGPDVWNA